MIINMQICFFEKI